MPTSILITADGDGIVHSAGTTTFEALEGALSTGPTTLEVEAHTRIHSTLDLADLLVRVIANATTASSTIRSRVNGANGNLSLTIGAGATGEFEDSPGTPDNLVDTDDADWQVITGTGGDLTISIISGTLTHVNVMTSILQATRTASGFRGSTEFARVSGTLGIDAVTEAQKQYRIRFAATWDKLRFHISANTTANGGTVTSRINGANGGQSQSFGGGATGDFEDATGSDSITAGDLIDYQVLMAGGGMPESAVFELMQTRLRTTPLNSFIAMSNAGIAVSVGATEFITLAGKADGNPTESEVQLKIRGGSNLARNLYVRIVTNSLTTASTTIRTRNNGANGSLSVTIGAGATGEFEDTDAADAEEYSNDDEVNYQIVVAAGGAGTILPAIIAIELAGVFRREFTESIFVEDVLSSVSTGVTNFVRLLTADLSSLRAVLVRNVDYRRGIVTSITIGDAIARVKGISFALIQDLSSIQSVLTRQVNYTRPIVADLSALRDAALRNAGYLRGIVTSLTISDAIARVKGISRSLIQDLSAIGTVFQRQVNYRRSLRNFLFIEDISRRVSTYFRGLNVAIVISAVSSFILPITQFIFNLRAAIVVSARVVRQVNYRRTFRDSVIVRDILSAVLPVAAPARSFLFYVGIKLRGRLLRR